MRCRVGDLAVIVGGAIQVEGLTGRIVKCVELLSQDHWRIEEPFRVKVLELCKSTSVIDGKKSIYHPGSRMLVRTIWDSWLMPIRDNPGADETLSWLEVPKPTTKRLTEAQFKAAEDAWCASKSEIDSEVAGG